MRFSTSKSIAAVIAIGTVGFLGAQLTNAGAAATPRVTPIKKNIAHVFHTSTHGGTDEKFYTFTNPGKGVYLASFTANFYPGGTPAAPETFSCAIIIDNVLVLQSTSSSTYSSGFFVGVNGVNVITLQGTEVLQAMCGTADGTSWLYGSKQFEVTFTDLDGRTNSALAPSATTRQTEKLQATTG